MNIELKPKKKKIAYKKIRATLKIKITSMNRLHPFSSHFQTRVMDHGPWINKLHTETSLKLKTEEIKKEKKKKKPI